MPREKHVCPTFFEGRSRTNPYHRPIDSLSRFCQSHLEQSRASKRIIRMDGTNGPKEATRVTASVASNTPTSNTLRVNVFTAPGKAMVGERPKPVGEPLGFDP